MGGAADTWLARGVDAGQPLDPAELAREVSVAPGFAGDLLGVLRAHASTTLALGLRAWLVRDRMTDAYLPASYTGPSCSTRPSWRPRWALPPRLPASGSTPCAPAAGATAGWLVCAARRSAAATPTPEQLQALQATDAGGGRPQPDQTSTAGWALARIEQL